ncbi:MAG: AmmeMemoRadiSam system protein B [Ignavibacteriales bacterium]|nr:AmmeMemoRadiSam system protein B [Ignavibacteriales bacterium]
MTVRPPAVAGTFYTANPKALSREIETMLADADVKDIPGSLLAIVVPHAGLVYSGKTAAHAYKLLQKRAFETIVIISPSHREYFTGISVFSGTAFRTPFGDIQVDEELRQEIIQGEKIIESSTRGQMSEHAIEVQLPFLQKVLKQFKILPIVVGDQRSEYCFHLGDKLAKVLVNRNALVVASSDLSHYHPADDADRLDEIIIDDIVKFNYKKLMEDIETERAEACGGGPIVAALTAAKQSGANHIEILHHCNSGDVSGDRDAVVGYLSAAALKIN